MHNVLDTAVLSDLRWYIYIAVSLFSHRRKGPSKKPSSNKKRKQKVSFV